MRNHKMQGYTFRRQHKVHQVITPLGVSYFVADFCCVQLKLIIELDGAVHTNDPEYDKVKQQILENKGFVCVHFSNDEVDYAFIEVIKQIELVVSELHKSTS